MAVFEDPAVEDMDNTEVDEDGERSAAWWWDPRSGSPSSLEETSMALLDSGFSPSVSPILCVKQSEVAKKALKFSVNKYHIDVPKSCSAWAVPGMSFGGNCRLVYSSDFCA